MNNEDPQDNPIHDLIQSNDENAAETNGILEHSLQQQAKNGDIAEAQLETADKTYNEVKGVGAGIKELAKALSPQEIGDGASFIVKGLKGDKGDKHTDEELITLIKPLIPEPIKGEDGKTPTEDELLNLIVPLIPDPIPGKDGEDYILTEDDKKEIASSIEVPIVEKVIVEKTEVVKEKTKDITATEIKKKLEGLKVGLDYDSLSNTPDINKIISLSQASKTVSLIELDDVDYSGLSFVDGKYVLGSGGGGGTVDSVVAGTGISVDSTDPANPIVTNSAPDQTVSITDSGIAVVTGTYPNFNVDVPATDLTSYFNKSVDDTDDITVGTTNKFATAAEKTKLGYISVTQAVDLDTIESDTATNNAKVTNATHTGEVTGATTLTVDKTAITGKTTATAVGSDYVLISDTSDTGNLKKALVSDIMGSGSVAWGSITGTLSSQTDLQTALDGKVDENGAITGATKTKITYDTKGLVTAGADATTADIADSTNKRYVTDAQLTVIGNTSGTNTGDQTSIVGITGTKAQFDTAVTDGNFLYVGDITQYTDEMAQDAVGAMVDSTLVYTDATPLLSRAALTGAITASAGSNTTALGSFTISQLNTAVSDADVATLAGAESLTNKKLGSLTSNGFVKTSGGDGTLSVDTSTYLTGNQTITLSGDVTGSGSTAITTTIAAGAVDIAMLSATGTPSSSTFLRGDNTWATPAGSGDVSKVGTPVNNQVGVWTGDGTIEGDANLTFDTTTDTLTSVNINATTFTGALTGNASTATTLATSRNIQGVAFNGSANIDIINGTGFVKATGTTLSYDNSTYLTTSSAASTYQPLDSDLTTIAGLTATTDNFIQSSGSAWASRTPTQATATLINFVGDSGSGGTKGLVPAPASGDASKYLKGDGTWATVSGSGSPGGSDTQVQFNDGGAFGGDAGFTFNKTTNSINLGIAGTDTTIDITSANADSANEDGVGLGIRAGGGIGTGVGGELQLRAGSASFDEGAGTGAGGSVYITSGNGGLTSGHGGDIQIVTGAANASGNGGNFSAIAGQGYGSGQYGGNIFFTAGGGASGASGGYVHFIASASSVAPNPDEIKFTADTGLYCFDNGAGSIQGKLDFTSLATSDKIFTFPNASGTFMLTSAIGTTVQAYDADLTTWAGITPGTGVGTALAVNVGSAGAFVTFNGALGTPSSGTLTNATGLPISGLVSSTSTALGVGSLELGHASDTTFTRVSAGVAAIEGNNILTTATGLPLSGGTMSGNITLGENTSIALDPAGSADGKYSGITMTATAGYTQAFGDLVYLSSSDSRWELADADAATTADRMLAMVVSAGTDGTSCTLLLQGNIRADAKFPTLTIGSPVYVGETAGAIQVAIPTGADNVIRRVGYALTADEIYFNPSMDSQITVA